MKTKVTQQQKQTVKKVLHYIKRYWFYLTASVLLAALIVALTLYLPILTGDAIDLILEPGKVEFQGIFSILKKMGYNSITKQRLGKVKF